jgi:hypothetical protein
MKKYPADCGLKVDLKNKDTTYEIKFTQSGGGNLATIFTKNIPSPHHLMSADVKPYWLTRAIFRITSGLREYELVCRLVSDNKPYEYANFFNSIDRNGRQRILAEICNCDGFSGSSFIVTQSDYDSVMRVLDQPGGEQDKMRR